MEGGRLIGGRLIEVELYLRFLKRQQPGTELTFREKIRNFLSIRFATGKSQK